MAPHAGRSGCRGAGDSAVNLRATEEEPLRLHRAVSGRGASLKPLSSEAASAPAVSSSSQRGSLAGSRSGRPGSEDRARRAEAARADTLGAPVKARRPGSQRRKRARRGAPAHSPRRRPGGRPQPLHCPTPAGSAGYPPPAQPGPRPGPWPVHAHHSLKEGKGRNSIGAVGVKHMQVGLRKCAFRMGGLSLIVGGGH